jgi:biotin carboxylase
VATAQQQSRLLIIAPHSSYRLAPYLRAAEALGLSPLIVSDGRHSLVTEVAQGLHIDFSDTDAALKQLLALAQQQPIAGVVATDDFTVALAARIAQALGLPCNPPQAALVTSRKDLSRACLQQADLPVPAFKLLHLDQDLEPQLSGAPLPCVIKPLSLSASRGVIRADTVDELFAACERLRPILRDQHDPDLQQTALLEAYLPGVEVAVEGIFHDGEFHCLAVFDKPDPLEGPFFEETYYITPSRQSREVLARIEHCTAEACRALGFVTGPVHAELRIDDGQPWLLEVAARTIGGECARLLQLGTGQTLEQLVVSYACGQPLPPEPMPDSAGVLMIPTPRSGVLRRVEGVLAAQQVAYIEDVHINIREGNELVALPEGASYLGFIFARGPDPATVEQALRDAHAQLNIVVAPLWKIEGKPASVV